MLKIADDIKEAIRNRGLKDALAKAVDKIKAKKLNIAEQKARKIRRKLIDEILKQELSLSQTNKKIKEIIAQYQPSHPKLPGLTKEVEKCIKSLESIQISNLDEFNRQNLIDIMQKKFGATTTIKRKNLCFFFRSNSLLCPIGNWFRSSF